MIFVGPILEGVRNAVADGTKRITIEGETLGCRRGLAVLLSGEVNSRGRKPSVSLYHVQYIAMPAYLFTFHAYRSWNADNPRGFVQRGKGIQPPNHNLARAYNAVAGAAPMIFGREHQRILIWVGCDVCARRGWRLHFTATEPTHVHYLVSWRGSEPWDQVSMRIKNIASLMLGRKLQHQTRWFSKSGSRKRVRDQGHFLYLMNEYLPRHSGLKWREGNDPPGEPAVKKPSAAAEG